MLMQTIGKHVKETQLQDVNGQKWKSLMTTVLLVTFSKCQRIHSRQNIKLWRHRSISKCVKFYSWKGSWFWLFTNFGAKKNQGKSFAHKNRTCHIQIMDDSHLAINYLRRPRPCWAGVLFASMQYEQHIFHYQQLCNVLSWGGVFWHHHHNCIGRVWSPHPTPDWLPFAPACHLDLSPHSSTDLLCHSGQDLPIYMSRFA